MEYFKDWGMLNNGLAVKNIYCSCRRPGFESQHPQGRLELLVTLVPGYPMPFFDL